MVRRTRLNVTFIRTSPVQNYAEVTIFTPYALVTITEFLRRKVTAKPWTDWFQHVVLFWCQNVCVIARCDMFSCNITHRVVFCIFQQFIYNGCLEQRKLK
jgi:hypothetical protein